MDVQCRDVLAFAPLLFRAAAWREGDATVELVLSGRGGGVFHLVVAEGRLTFHDGAAPRADAVVEATDEVFLRLLRNELNPATAYLRRQIRVRGRLGLARHLLDPRVLPREVAAAAHDEAAS
jgi:putative sterol carrier protein